MDMYRDVIGKCRAKIITYVNEIRLARSQSSIKKLKGKYTGNRCFIIGNGPSLTAEDLNKLHKNKEICFGTHRIYHIFDNTNWRPTFYCAQDSKLITEDIKTISKLNVKNKFIAIVPDYIYRHVTDAIYIRIIRKAFYPDFPEFSEDIIKGEYEGFTVTYFCFQLAAYMGFDEIVLLGVDHAYSVELNPDGSLKENNSINDHFSERDKVKNIPQTYKSTLAYYAAKQYADKHGIKILNATRGGKLEVFERVDFDSIIADP